MSMGFSEVTGGPRRASRSRAYREPRGLTTRGRKTWPSRRALFFCNVSMGEPAGPDMSGECGVPQAGRRYITENTRPRAL